MLREVACQVGLPSQQDIKCPSPKIEFILGRGMVISVVLALGPGFVDKEEDEADTVSPGDP